MKGRLGLAKISFLSLSLISAGAATPPLRFDRDTVGFANMTVFEYQNGIAHLRRGESAKQKRYTRRCFVLWRAPLPDDQRVVFPGYANLRQLSKVRGFVLQRNIGYGWPTYWRLGNARTFFEPGTGYQERTHEKLNAILNHGDLFVGFLTTLPHLRINHAVLFYAKEAGSGEIDRYLVYDPNHPEGPRHLGWSQRERSFEYEKDWDFVGGRVRVYQIYGMPLQ